MEISIPWYPPEGIQTEDRTARPVNKCSVIYLEGLNSTEEEKLVKLFQEKQLQLDEAKRSSDENNHQS